MKNLSLMKKINKMSVMALLCLGLLGSMYSFSSNPDTGKSQVLRHVVAFQFKADVSEEQQAQAIQNFQNLQDEIPEIKKFEGGENVSVEELDKGLTHCFILTFENEAARDIYLPHPAHIRVAKENKPLMSNLVVLDVWGAE